MSKKLFFLMLILATGFFYAFKPAPTESKLIGSWKVESVLRSNGKTKEGRKTITFSKDKTILSVKETGSQMTGYWEFLPESDLLKISVETKENWKEYKVLKLSRKRLIIKDERKTYNLIKVKLN